MSDCHLVEVPISLPELHKWAEHRNLGSGGKLDEGLALHHLLAETFGPGVLQPFRLMTARGGLKGTILGYSKTDGEGLAATASGVAQPSIADVLALDRLRSLPRPGSAWRAGQRLGFDLRARPVVRLASKLEGPEGSISKGAEVDAFLVRALRGETAPDREAVYLDWLAVRLRGIAELDQTTTRLAQFRRNTIRRNGRSLEGPDTVFHGTFTITDPEAFATALASGIGRHRSYGYGMMLLRAPQRLPPC